MKKITARGQKKTELCKVKRQKDINVIMPDKPEFLRTRITRDAIMQFKHEHKTREEVSDYIETEIAKLPSLSETVRDLQKAEVITLVNKYLDADNRISEPCPPKKVTFGDYELYVAPDFLYYGESDTDLKGLPVVEVVIMTTGKQLYATGRVTADKCIASLWHNAAGIGGLLYGKELLNGRVGYVRVVSDNLKTDKDRSDDYSRPWSVQKAKGSTKGDNRAFIEVLFDETGNALYPSDVFSSYKKGLEEWEKGKESESCTQETCSQCSYNELCHYNKRPVLPEQEAAIKKSVSNFEITPEQAKVIGYRKGICVVNAGPGSGKTQSVALRIAEFLSDGVKAEDICVISFSKAAIEAISNRVNSMIKDVYELDIDTSKIKIASFNSLGNEVIEKYYKMFGFTEVPTLIDDVEELDLIARTMVWDRKIATWDYKNPAMRKNKNFAGGAVFNMRDAFNDIQINHGTNFKDRHPEYTDGEIDIVMESFCNFRAAMKESNLINYADQSNFVWELMESNDDLIVSMFSFEHIIVDEFQDSNDFQMEFLRCLAYTSKFKSLMVVGDDAQAIYRFRDATPENIINFSDKWDCATPIDDLYLSVNHRSVPEIVELSNELIKLNTNQIEKTMTSSRCSLGKKPVLKGFEDKKSEAQWIADKIEQLINEGEKPSDIAFISFTRNRLKAVSKELSERGIISQYDLPEVYVENSRVMSVIAFSEFLKDTMGSNYGFILYLNEVMDGKLFDFSEANFLIDKEMKAFQKAWQLSNFEQKKEIFLNYVQNLDDGTDGCYSSFMALILKKAARKDYDIIKLLDYIAKFKIYGATQTAEKECRFEAVNLVTAHSSKGKEWKYVFGSLSDFDNSNLDFQDIEERVRLMFVMVTRAKDILTVTSEKERSKEGDVKPLNRFYQKAKSLNGFNGD